jgi:glycerate 2-kinase
VRIVAAPCTFKESLTASAVASIMARVASGFDHVVDVAPLADGGEGTLDALRLPLGLQLRSSVIRRMLDPGVAHVRWGLDGEGRAFIEAAEAIGLALVPREQRDPLRASTRGLGDLIVEASRDPAVHDVLLALGGTATVDGGADMRDVVTRAWSSHQARRVPITALVDVDVPLDGARMFMKQKLGPAQGDDVIETLAGRLRALFPPEIARVAGAGAAGGLGAAVLALGGRLVPGAAYVMDAIGLEERVAAADVVWTGEGRIDEQTVHGKAVASLAQMCRVMKKPLVAFCGSTRGDLTALRALGVTDVVTIARAGQPLDEAMAQADANLATALEAWLAAHR